MRVMSIFVWLGLIFIVTPLCMIGLFVDPAIAVLSGIIWWGTAIAAFMMSVSTPAYVKQQREQQEQYQRWLAHEHHRMAQQLMYRQQHPRGYPGYPRSR